MNINNLLYLLIIGLSITGLIFIFMDYPGELNININKSYILKPIYYNTFNTPGKNITGHILIFTALTIFMFYYLMPNLKNDLAGRNSAKKTKDAGKDHKR